ncbi:hypothetical protein BLNAU_15151 [Blattamonas nauphoetae]|uniref:4Fe-4S ferredoxin-type domain-containing protein n=1 Tax=Blattamonas nauphoetae TaxID=2049346 RepID=A0ABQ9XF13_9EUKA|nr:hypothetical protein BLNAU_15151 [Blattamonas nauphoetae]
MASQIRDILVSKGHTCTEHDGFVILKEVLSNVTVDSRVHMTHPNLHALHTDLHDADGIGVGCYCNYFDAPPGVDLVFSENTIPPEIFQNIRCYFTFASYGDMLGSTLTTLSTIVQKRLNAAEFLGSFAMRAPQNSPALQPRMGTVDAIREKELAKLVSFGDDLVSSLSPHTKIKTHRQKIPSQNCSRAIGRSIFGDVDIEDARCTRCSTCVTRCPYNALSISDFGKIVWDRSLCQFCGRCFNSCPSRAINFPRLKTELREQYTWDMNQTHLKSNGSPSSIAVLHRNFIGKRPLEFFLFGFPILLVLTVVVVALCL